MPIPGDCGACCWHTVTSNCRYPAPMPWRLGNLPPLHRDPFDRLLIAQAREECMILLTVDEKVLAYGEGVLRV